MTNPNHTRIVFLLDRSGSMSGLKTEVEGGFNAFIDEQRKAEGTCDVTLAQFDNVYELVYAQRPLDQVPPLDLQPRGMTALLDAMGRVITDTGAQLSGLPEDERPGTVILAIMTDGLENNSHEWTRAAVKKLVKQQERDYGWQILYMGANQDAIEEGASFGVSAHNSMTYTPQNAASVMRSTASNIAAYRTSVVAGMPLMPMSYTDEQRREAVQGTPSR